ncbi:MAG: alpha/beta hydrolase family protein [Planctomycetota bacterium]|nr:alpha/beta hydrolase family protein [Planctomycetota bacterium]
MLLHARINFPRRHSLSIVLGSLIVTIATRVGSAQAENPQDYVDVPKTITVDFKPASSEEDVPDRFRLKSHAFSSHAELLRKSGPVRVFRVQFPSPVETDVPENNTVHAEYFQPEGPGPFPGCVVLHILGGEFPLSQMTANALARKGVASLFIKMPFYGERRSPTSSRRMIARNPHETVANMTQAVLDIRRGAAWLSARPEVDNSNLGVTGISLGGIMSALSAAGEPRFQNVAIYLGGGQLAEILWEMERSEAGDFREEWIRNGGSRQSFLDLVSPVDPAKYGHLLKSRRVLMVNALHDEIIPKESTLALWESIDKPEIVWLDAGHITAAAFLYGENERLCNFFTAKEQSRVKP